MIKLNDLNNATVIILEAEDFLKIKVDKTSRKIVEMMHTGTETNRDATEGVLHVASQYSLGDIVVDTPYNLSDVLKRILDGTVNKNCVKILKFFDKIIFE